MVRKGSFIKMRFTQKGKTPESMWVKVTKVKQGEPLEGKLRNTPVNLTNVKLNKKIKLKGKKYWK